MATLMTDGRTLRGYLEDIIEMDLARDSPQIHAHYLTEEDERLLLGYSKLEVCCHGCGKATLIMYKDLSVTEQVREAFLKEHFSCKDLGFEDWCPDIRLSCEVIDLRQVIPINKEKKNNLLTRLSQGVKHRPTSP